MVKRDAKAARQAPIKTGEREAAERLLTLRKAGESDAAFARRIGLSSAHIHNYKERKAGLGVTVLAKLTLAKDDLLYVLRGERAANATQPPSGRASESKPDPDLERICGEFHTAELRLMAMENLAAVKRARAIEHEGEAATSRAGALDKAEQRALAMCRGTTTDGNKGLDPRPQTEEA